MRRMHRSFSLIELMVVVAIIGILATVVTMNVMSNIDKANVARVRFDFGIISKAAKLYKLDTGRYPRELSELLNPPGGGESLLENDPVDPWKRPYIYELRPGQNPPFVILCYGADGAPGGEGGDADLDSTALLSDNQE